MNRTLTRYAAPVLLMLFAALLSALPPLHEMDLSQHLANGGWMVEHGRILWTDPFSWPREGQPFYAYSWLADVLFYWLLQAFGPFALHLLEAFIAAAAVAAAWWAATRLGATRVVAFALSVMHLLVFWGLANTLRPQQFLWIAVPLAWGACASIRANGLSVARGAVLLFAAALAANTHVFFALTAVPVAFYGLADTQWRKWLIATLIIVIGWLLTPYGLHWPEVFKLYFGPNVLLSQPPSNLDVWPGVLYARDRPGVVLAAATLLVLPWLASRAHATTRERLVTALFWSFGLILFAYAGRLLLAWWTLCIPLFVIAAERSVAWAKPHAQTRLSRLAAVAVCAVLLIRAAPPVAPVFWLFEGDVVHRMLPRGGEDAALWLPSWLLCNTKPGAHGRIFNEYNYGSELNWRLPGYQTSIDGRNIFPDSDGVEFSLQPYGRRRVHATTWTNADLALLDRSFWLAPVLDQHPDWVLLANSRKSARTGSAGLWAKRDWWTRWGTGVELPALDVRPGDPRGTCELTGAFPKAP